MTTPQQWVWNALRDKLWHRTSTPIAPSWPNTWE